MALRNVSFGIKGFKCFGADSGTVPQVRPMNLVIGRNNSGKSAILDVVAYLCEPKDIPPRQYHGRMTPDVTITTSVDETALRKVFSDRATDGGIKASNHWVFGQRYVGARLTFRVEPNHHSALSLEPPFDLPAKLASNYLDSLAQTIANPFTQFRFLRLAADRDITPEEDSGNASIAPTGTGFTNIVQTYLNKADLPTELIEEDLLSEVNRIFQPDAHFTRIQVQQLGDARWELYLTEAGKTRVALSQSGSGLKTVLLILGLLHLMPRILRMPVSQFIFGFEEPENNLHPALQRRLLRYLLDMAVEKQSVMFVTTHSHVAIDLLATSQHAQILHVSGPTGAASIRTATTYVEHHGVLDDLDIRASDLLQANGVVWVEGPSDRLYFNRWVSLWSGGELSEGLHYQCVFYGGRLLAHLTASDPSGNIADVVAILRVNRNAILLIDSDRDAEGRPISKTKQRLIDELEGIGGLTWVTAGREVENYIPAAALQRVYENPSLAGPVSPHADFADYLGGFSPEEKDRFIRNKVLYAERILLHVDPDSLVATLDMSDRLREVCDRIRGWNRLPAPS